LSGNDFDLVITVLCWRDKFWSMAIQNVQNDTNRNYIQNFSALKVSFKMEYQLFCAMGFFNEADTLESSSILSYYFKEQSIYIQKLAQSHIS
jgi:hypothetical protein